MKVWQKAVLVASLPCSLVMAVVAWSAGGFFGGTEVCTTCGRTKSTSRIFWIPTTKINGTELSEFYDRYKGDEQTHSWIFASGGGGSITCAIGSGRYLYSAIMSSESRDALGLIQQQLGDEAADEWLGRLLDPELSRDAYRALMPMILDFLPFEVGYERAEENYAFSRESADAED